MKMLEVRFVFVCFLN